jgi:hypothetical protein
MGIVEMLPLPPGADESSLVDLGDCRTVIAVLPHAGVLQHSRLGRFVEEDAVPFQRMALRPGVEELLEGVT